MKRRILLQFAFLFLALIRSGGAEIPRDKPIELTLDNFVQEALKNDTEFERILIDELALAYEKDLRLPAKDLVLRVREDYQFFLKQDRDDIRSNVSLSKLFPKSGTELEASYEITPSITSDTRSSELGLSLTQPIAENAFGKATRLLDKIIGLEVDVARHQVVEAYEDYLGTVLIAFYDWAEAYQKLEISRSSYVENLKLLDNIKKRQGSRIALPIDVNKIQLQVLAKKESLVEREEQYLTALHTVQRMTRSSGDTVYVPAAIETRQAPRDDFEAEFAGFKGTSRTYDILRLLEERSSLAVEKAANELLPSLDLIVDYTRTGDDRGLENYDDRLSAGLALEWPVTDQVKRAEKDLAKIDLERTRLENANVHQRIYTQLKNLYQQLFREKALLEIGEEKIRLARSVLKDEEENYSFGRVTLNDYIQAVNTVDNNRFNVVTRDFLYRKLLVDWKRLTDSLISKAEIPFKTP